MVNKILQETKGTHTVGKERQDLKGNQMISMSQIHSPLEATEQGEVPELQEEGEEEMNLAILVEMKVQIRVKMQNLRKRTKVA